MKRLSLTAPTLYHGTSKTPFSDFRTPTGRDDWAITEGGVVYLTDDMNVAARYAGPAGNIAVITAPQAKPYKQALQEIGRKKAPKYTRGVWVVPPHLIQRIEWEPSYPVLSERKKRKRSK